MHQRSSLSLTVLTGVILLWLGACGGAPAAVAPPALDDSFYLGGIQVNEPDHPQWMASLRAAGMNTVSATVYAHQGNWNTDHLWFDADSKWVLHEIRQAKKAGLKVVLILRVALDHTYLANSHLWHGMIMPGTEEQIRGWFMRYTSFVQQWARVAEAEGVDVLGIASEMNALASTIPIEEIPVLEEYYLNAEKQTEFKQDVLAGIAAGARLDGTAEESESVGDFLAAKVETFESWAGQMTAYSGEDHLQRINRRRALLEECWLWLIESTREVYSGKLTYAANFDQYHQVGFWEQLDLIGINAYFPLRKRFLDESQRDQLPALLQQGWREVMAGIDSFRASEGIAEMPVIFTELGYTERRDSTLAPWAGDNFTVVWGEPDAVAEGEEPLAAEKRLIVWQNQPLEPTERWHAIAALRQISQQEFPNLLQGILYWKLSTQIQHREIEPFVAILSDDLASQPLIEELAKFRR